MHEFKKPPECLSRSEYEDALLTVATRYPATAAALDAHVRYLMERKAVLESTLVDFHYRSSEVLEFS